jgi:hypothetical protein
VTRADVPGELLRKMHGAITHGSDRTNTRGQSLAHEDRKAGQGGHDCVFRNDRHEGMALVPQRPPTKLRLTFTLGRPAGAPRAAAIRSFEGSSDALRRRLSQQWACCGGHATRRGGIGSSASSASGSTARESSALRKTGRRPRRPRLLASRTPERADAQAAFHTLLVVVRRSATGRPGCMHS